MTTARELTLVELLSVNGMPLGSANVFCTYGGGRADSELHRAAAQLGR